MSDGAGNKQVKTSDLLCGFIHQKKELNDVMFTHECTVRCALFLSKHYRRIGDQAVSKPKYPLSVHVCAGMSSHATTDIAIFVGIMDSSSYRRIFNEYLKQFVAKAYSQGHRLWQDNDPKHISKLTQEWMGVN